MIPDRLRAPARAARSRVRRVKSRFDAYARSARDQWTDHRPIPIPPAGLRFMNETEERFLATGDELLIDLRRWTTLDNHGDILDVGSGYGRFAHALLREKAFSGRYLGVDILPRHIEWSATHLARAFRPTIRFEHLDVHNARYNPRGTIAGDEVVLPVPSGSVEAILLSSVFTHMYESNILRYLSECRRVLRMGGHIVASFFLLEEGWAAGEANKKSAYPMVHKRSAHCRYANADDPLFAIGYDPAWLVDRLGELGLFVVGQPYFGSWCGRPNGGPRWQDFVVLTKR